MGKLDLSSGDSLKAMLAENLISGESLKAMFTEHNI